MKKILALFFLFPMVSFAGGDPTGGGNFTHPTDKDVIAEANRAWTLVTGARMDNPILQAYIYLTHNDNAPDGDPTYNKLIGIIEKILGPEGIGQMNGPYDYDADLMTKNLAGLRSKKLQFKSAGDCLAPEHEHEHRQVDASVSRLSFSGEICVSISKWKKLPKGDPVSNIVPLLVHEIAHLNGYHEKDAQFIQNFFVDHIRFFLRTAGEAEKEQYSQEVASESTRWYHAIKYDTLTAGTIAQIYGMANTITNAKLRFPDAYSGDDLQLAHPELATRTLDKIQIALDRGGDFLRHCHAENPDWNSRPVTEQTLADMRAFFIAELDAEEAVNFYLFGDDIPLLGLGPIRSKDRIQVSRDLVIQATAPAALTDENARPDFSRAQYEGFFALIKSFASEKN